MKYFITTDIHSFYTIFKQELDKSGFDINNNNEHVLVICGDLFDKGEEHQQLIDFILSLPECRTLLVTGNHEDLMDTLIERGYPLQHDVSNGTYATLMELCELPYRSFTTEQVKKILEDKGYYKVRSRMKDYIELNDYIFVHGWIPCISEDFYNSKDLSLAPRSWWDTTEEYDSSQIWKDARWLNGMSAWKQGCVISGKTIVCGHFHTSWAWSHIRQKYKEFPHRDHEDFNKSFKPFIDKGIIALDACTGYSKQINIYTVEI